MRLFPFGAFVKYTSLPLSVPRCGIDGRDAVDNELDLRIPTLGEQQFESPLGLSTIEGDEIADYTDDLARLPHDPIGAPTGDAFELAGARKRVFFEGANVKAAIVTCGGLCPGMNDVIRGIVSGLWQYGVRNVLGFRYGYGGLDPDASNPPIELTPDVVDSIHLQGGTVLGSSRGPREAAAMTETLISRHINILFCIGGDGTMRGALALFEEISRRKLPIAIIGVPKTIDNDLPYVEQTFGFETAVSFATQAIRAAHVEAQGALNGLGIVRLMGRHSGFIAASATLASRQVDLVLVPELPFDLTGEKGIAQFLKHRLESRGHAVLVVAEGAGQRHLEGDDARDLSGNKKLADIGTFLRDHLNVALQDLGASLKYIDPSYIIRAAPANSADAIFCGRLAEDAVHAAMAGKTGLLVGLWYNRFTHIPLSLAASKRKLICLDGSFWRNVVESTGQPAILHGS